MAEIQVRAESPADVEVIRDINFEAFRDHPISRHTEHLIVDALRAAGALDVSLVAVCDGRAVGHIAFSAARVGELEGRWYVLGPVAVLPDAQGRGIGSALVEAGLAELRARSADGCVLVGDPRFYGRFGFSAIPELTYVGVPHEHVLALPLEDVIPRGVISAHPAFEIEPDSDPGRV